VTAEARRGGRPAGTGGSRPGRVVAALVAGVIGLGGCASPPVDLSAQAGARLQEAVWSVTSAAAQGRLDAAATGLERVRAELDRAVEADAISVRRYREVDDAIRAVEAEVEALQAASSAAPAPADEPEPAPESVVAPLPVEPPAPAGDGAPGDGGGTGAGEGEADRAEDGGGAGGRGPGGDDGGPDGAGNGNQGNGVGPDGNRGRGRG
jgi:hypothetical protein